MPALDLQIKHRHIFYSYVLSIPYRQKNSIVNIGEKSILFSTHITSDLDKVADFIVFIKDGRIVANTTKDDLLESHLLVKGGADELPADLKDAMISVKVNRFGFVGLIKKDDYRYGDRFVTEIPDLEDIMVYYNKEADHE